MRYEHHPVTGALQIVMLAHEDPEALREMEQRYERTQAERERLRHEGPRPSWRRMLREAMRLHEVSNADLAREMGIAQSSVGHWLSGRSKPSRDRVAQVCKVLDLPRGAFLDAAGYEP